MKVDIYGTGFIVEYNNQLFIITCKHEYEKAKNKNAIFVITNPKQTWTPKEGYFLIELGTPYFHPDDNTNETYDIVVFKLLKYDKQTLLSKGIIPLLISNNYIYKHDKANNIFAVGYPGNDILYYFDKNNEDSLPLRIVEGYPKEINLETTSQEGFIGDVKEAFFIKTKDYEEMGKGVSGGLVFIKKDPNSIIPIGLIIGEKTDVESNLYTKRKVHYVGFAKMERVVEVLKNIK